MSDTRYPCMSGAASIMPLLPRSSSTPTNAMQTNHATTQASHRDISYHMDSHGRYAIQSYEVRPSSRQFIETQSPYWRRPRPTDYYPVLQSIERADPAASRSTPRSSIVVVHLGDDRQLNKTDSKGIAVNTPKPVAIPPAPRPRRLSTPELSDLDDDKLFCHCDAKKTCNSQGGYLRRTCRRALS